MLVHTDSHAGTQYPVRGEVGMSGTRGGMATTA
jgi:hypothetical protein